MRTLQTSQRFIGVSAALFIGSAALTIAWSSAHDMPMCSVRSFSGQTLPSHAFEFLAMWLMMSTAMMLPSLLPSLWRYRRSVAAATAAQLDALTMCVGLGYFFAWMAAGVLAFAASDLIDAQRRDVPMLTGAIVLIAGVLQFGAWKARHLACCRAAPKCCETLHATAQSAWRHGVRLGWHCVHCCFGLTVALLAIGMMDLRAMALVTIAISAERLAPNAQRVARFIGVVLIAMGALMIAHAS